MSIIQDVGSERFNLRLGKALRRRKMLNCEFDIIVFENKLSYEHVDKLSVPIIRSFDENIRLSNI